MNSEKIKSIGKEGEKVALNYLINHGYIVAETNYWSRFGEIDIIFRDQNSLVFQKLKVAAMKVAIFSDIGLTRKSKSASQPQLQIICPSTIQRKVVTDLTLFYCKESKRESGKSSTSRMPFVWRRVVHLSKRLQVLIALSLFTTILFTVELTASIIITEIMPNPESSGEWIEIFNNSAEENSIVSWSLSDRTGSNCLFPQYSGVRQSKTYAVLAQDSITLQQLKLNLNVVAIVLDSRPSLNNEGDELILTLFNYRNG